jgi:hypothetical protein
VRAHEQALRQLYVLACEKRIMRAIDVNIRQPVYVPVTLAMASEHPTTQQAPLDASRNENEPLNTPSNALASYDGKGFNDPESGMNVFTMQVCCVAVLACNGKVMPDRCVWDVCLPCWCMNVSTCGMQGQPRS